MLSCRDYPCGGKLQIINWKGVINTENSKLGRGDELEGDIVEYFDIIRSDKPI